MHRVALICVVVYKIFVVGVKGLVHSNLVGFVVEKMVGPMDDAVILGGFPLVVHYVHMGSGDH
ncbi:hypothetical protein [Pasteuria penetrans]|uniref:hypothetical protein n=1 Tax=Pasteuria penetrans TaxID=86005 RepID=UPI000F92119E|nr:hypothetical protein [Pasteuria penetrans]